MFEHGRGGEARDRAALVFRHARMEFGRAADVQFGDDEPVPRRRFRPGFDDGRGRDNGFRHRRGTVGFLRAVEARHEAEHRGGKLEGPVDGERVGVEQQLAGVEPVPGPGIVGSLHPQAVARAGADALDEAVEHVAGAARQANALDLGPTGVVEEAEPHRFRMGGENRYIDAAAHHRDTPRLGPPLAHKCLAFVRRHEFVPVLRRRV